MQRIFRLVTILFIGFIINWASDVSAQVSVDGGSYAAAYPGASEGLYDNIDSDCDGDDYAYDLSDGETRFNQVCSNCHVNSYAPDLYTVVPSLSAQQVYDIIINGTGYMAAQGNNPNLQNTQNRVNTAEYVWQTYQ